MTTLVANSTPARAREEAVGPPPAPRGVVWIDVAAASARMGVSERRVRQLCVESWAPAGLAKISGEGKWSIREDADPNVARVKLPEHIAFDWSTLRKVHRDELMRRKAIVDAWHKARAMGLLARRSEDETTIAFLASLEAERGEKVSRGTLYRWHSAWRSQGLAGLVDGRWTERTSSEADPFLAEVKRLYLLPNKRLPLSVCHTMATLKAEESGWEARSYKTCQRFIERIPKAVLVKTREGTEAFAAKVEPYQERDYSTLRSNEEWVGDHHQFDVIVKGPGGKPCRPWLTAWEDARSRKIVGWTIFAHDPNSDTILEAFRRGVESHGVPDGVYIDNGRDYKSAALGGASARKVRVEHDAVRLTGVFGGLGVGKTHCLPYRPQAKPIERFFRTVETRFGPLWDTYCGSSPDQKPEGLAGRVKKAPELADLVHAFTDWLENDYHHRAHFGDAMEGGTPAEVFAKCLDVKRMAKAATLAVLCLRPSRPTKVTRNGVRFDGLHYSASELYRLLGREVILRVDDRDRRAVLVFTMEDKFICRAVSAKKIPFRASSEELREAHRQKAAVRRKTREYHEQVRPRMADDLVDAMTRKRVESSTPKPSEPGPSGPAVIRPVRSAIEDQLSAIQRAVNEPQIRRAAGAESMSLTEVGDILLRSQERHQPALPAIDPFTALGEQLRSQT